MIVRLLLWRLDERTPSLDELRSLIGRDPDLFEELDTL
jgi:hypothetical protein